MLYLRFSLVQNVPFCFSAHYLGKVLYPSYILMMVMNECCKRSAVWGERIKSVGSHFCRKSEKSCSSTCSRNKLMHLPTCIYHHQLVTLKMQPRGQAQIFTNISCMFQIQSQIILTLLLALHLWNSSTAITEETKEGAVQCWYFGS